MNLSDILDKAYALALAAKCHIEIEGVPASNVPAAFTVETLYGDTRQASLTLANGSVILLMLA